MINRVGYTDNRTSFGAWIKPDKNGYYDKLYNITIGFADNSKLGEIIEFAKELRYMTPKHELEIISLSEGSTQRAIVRNNATGSVASFETKDGLHELLPRMLQNLNDMAEKKLVFWDDKAKSAKLYRILTGQNEKVDAVI